MEENQRDAPSSTGKVPKFTAKLDGRTNDRELADYLATKESKSKWIEACAFIGMLIELQKGEDMIAKAAKVRESRKESTESTTNNNNQ